MNFCRIVGNFSFTMPNELAGIAHRVLLLRCQIGDAAAFADLVAQHQGRLRGYLRALLGHDAAAEDALQDVWLAIWRGLPRLKEPDAFVAWALRIARDRAFRELRRRGVATVVVDETLPADEPSEFSAEDAAEVQAAVGVLPTAHRDVVLLRYVEELSYSEIATILQVPVGTVRSRLFHAKRLLHDILKPEEDR